MYRHVIIPLVNICDEISSVSADHNTEADRLQSWTPSYTSKVTDVHLARTPPVPYT